MMKGIGWAIGGLLVLLALGTVATGAEAVVALLGWPLVIGAGIIWAFWFFNRDAAEQVQKEDQGKKLRDAKNERRQELRRLKREQDENETK